MKLEIDWRIITSTILAGALLIPGIASAEMSDLEQRLKALDRFFLQR